MRLVWEFAHSISIIPNGIDCKQTWCKKIYQMNIAIWLNPFLKTKVSVNIKLWDFACLHFAQYILISQHGIDCKQTWCKPIYCMNGASWLNTRTSSNSFYYCFNDVHSQTNYYSWYGPSDSSGNHHCHVSRIVQLAVSAMPILN